LIRTYIAHLGSKEHLKEISDDFFCDWYLIKSENEIVGWARMKSFSHKLALSWAD
jgi:hypothetical protein